MNWLDYLIVAAYLLLTLALGLYFGRHQSKREFFAASNSMGWLTVGLSVMATLFSSNSFVMYPSAAYGSSLRVWLTLVAVTLMAPLVIWVFIPVYTRLQCQTAYDYLERRFHVSVRCLASGLFILLRISWMASATFAASLVVANVAGVSQISVILALGVVSILYTMIGGLRAVMWTDVIQFFIFASTIALALILVVWQSGKGLTEIARIYSADRPGMLFDFSPDITLKFGSWAILTGIFLEALSAFGADQVAVQRYLAARSERTSQIGFGLNLLGMWLVIPCLLLIGMGLFVHFQQRPAEMVPVLQEYFRQNPDEAELLPHQSGESISAQIDEHYRQHPEQVAVDVRGKNLQDQAMPQFVRLHFPPGMMGLFLAALMAAVMSSIDSGIHSVTTALVVDFRDRLRPDWKPVVEGLDVQWIRVLVVLIGTISVTLACFVGSLGDVFDIGKKMTAGFGGPLLAVFVLALFVRRVTTFGVFVGTFTAAAATLLLMYFYSEWFSVWFWPIGFGLAILLASGLSWLGTMTTDSEKGKICLTYWEVMRRSRQLRKQLPLR